MRAISGREVMVLFVRVSTPDLEAEKHFKLARNFHKAQLVFKSTTQAFCLLTLFLFCAVTSVSAQHYLQTNLVSDVQGLAQFTDADLVNPWGLISTGTSPWWVADNGTGLSTLYNGSGVKPTLRVTVASSTASPSTPTGVVNTPPGTTDFRLGVAANTAARFIFVTEDGTISGWNPAVDPTHSVIKVNNAGSAIYKGVTIAQSGGANFLYVADFFNGTVDVFDANFAPVTTLPAGAFT